MDDNIKKKAIDKLPVRQDFVLEIINKKPSFLIRYGGFFTICLVLIIVLFVYIIFKEYGLIS